jgi:hypothetical protein
MFSRYLLNIYFLLLPFKSWPNFSSLIPQSTLADFLFVVLGLLSLSNYKKLMQFSWWTKLDFLAITWLLIGAFLLIAIGATPAGLRELTASFYVVCLYFSVRLIVESQEVLNIVNAIVVSVSIWAIIAILGWLVAMASQVDSQFVISIKSYPYLGSIYRAQALTGSPNMLLSFLMIGVLFCWARLLMVTEYRLINIVAFMVMFCALLLTFSRDILIVCAGMVIIYYLASPTLLQNSRRKFIFLSLFLITAFYIFLSHFVITSNNLNDINLMIRGEYIIGDNPILIFGKPDGGYVLFPSIYLELKKIAFHAFLDSWGLGIGGGNFNQYLFLLKGGGLYPEKFTEWDPHSTYFGTIAEYGLIGFLTLFGILVFLYRTSFYVVLHLDKKNFISVGFVGVFLGILLEAICVDIMNFRQYWILFALFASLYQVRNHVKHI